MSGGAAPMDKILLLMEESGCDRAQAELALSLSDYDLEKAVRALGTLLRHIVAVKGKAHDADGTIHGRALVLVDTRGARLIRVRAVVSRHPGVFEAALGDAWHEFEKRLYADRLGEGARPEASRELERRTTEAIESSADEFFPALTHDDREWSETLSAAWAPLFGGSGAVLRWERNPLNWDEYRVWSGGAPRPAVSFRADGTVVVSVKIETDPSGAPADTVRPGDVVACAIDDPRDLARCLARLLGASAGSARPFGAPVESIERIDGELRVGLRLSTGVVGAARVAPSALLRVMRPAAAPPWRRWLPF